MNKSRLLWKAKVTVQDSRREAIEGPGVSGHRWVPDGQSEVTYMVEVSENGIRDMAIRAAKNKSGKSVDGPFSVIITSRRKISTV